MIANENRGSILKQETDTRDLRQQVEALEVK